MKKPWDWKSILSRLKKLYEWQRLYHQRF